jgi:hypothetical protein
MPLHAFEQRREDGILVDPRRKFLVIVASMLPPFGAMLMP